MAVHTVTTAASHLGITEATVRTRIGSGELRWLRDEHGDVHVFLDEPEMELQGQIVKPAKAKGRTRDELLLRVGVLEQMCDGLRDELIARRLALEKAARREVELLDALADLATKPILTVVPGKTRRRGSAG